MRALLLAAALLVPLAAAQVPFLGPAVSPTSVEVVLGEPPGTVKPLGPFIAIPITLRYTFMELPAGSEPTAITLAVAEVPPFMAATVSPTTVFAAVGLQTPPCGCERTTEVESFLLVTADSRAPAMRPATLAVTAAAGENGPHEPSEGRGEVEVTPGAFVLVRAAVAEPILKVSRGTSVERDIVVTNQGNGDVRVAFTLREGAPRGIEVGLPPPLTVGSSVLGGEETASARVHVNVGADALAGDFTVLLEARSVDDPTAEPDTTRASFVVDVAGAPREGEPAPARTPGPGLEALLVAVILALLARRDVV